MKTLLAIAALALLLVGCTSDKGMTTLESHPLDVPYGISVQTVRGHDYIVMRSHGCDVEHAAHCIERDSK